MTSRATVMRAMAVARYDAATAKKSIADVRSSLKSFALVEITKLTRKHPGKEVLFSTIDTECILYIQGVPVAGGELAQRFSVAKKQLGLGAFPEGLFLGIDGRVSYTRFVGGSC